MAPRLDTAANCTVLAPRPQQCVEGQLFHRWTTPEGGTWTEFYRRSDGYTLRFPGMADFEVSADGSAVGCHPAADCSEHPDVITDHLYLNQVFPLVQSLTGAMVFHAGAVSIGTGAVALVGLSGRGKSTLTAHLALNGHPFLTDDGLVVCPAETAGSFEVHPAHPSIRLWRDSETALVPAETHTAPPLNFTSKMRFLAGRQLPHCTEPRPLQAACFLGRGDADSVCLTPMPLAEALREWMAHSFIMDVGNPVQVAQHFKAVTALVRGVTHYRLDYPRDYAVLPEVAAVLRGALLPPASDQPQPLQHEA